MQRASEAQVIALDDVRRLRVMLTQAAEDFDFVLTDGFAQALAVRLLRRGVTLPALQRDPPPMAGQLSIPHGPSSEA